MRTARLLLRSWTEADRVPFAELNADPAVMEYFPSLLSRSQSDAMVDRIEDGFQRNGFGLWAVEVVGVAPFIGFVGLSRAVFPAHFTPAVEIGWRLAREHWGHGYATEAGREVIRFAFDDLALDEIVSFTSVVNRRSRAVMERLGMQRDRNGDFQHTALPPGHPLRAHVLYRLQRPSVPPP